MAELTIEYVPIDSLTPHERNVRQGDIGAITESLNRHDQYRSIVVSKESNRILAGNHTWKAMKARGDDTIAVTMLEGLTEDDELRIMLADNATADAATNDPTALAELLLELSATTDRLDGTGYDPDGLDALISELERGTMDLDDSTDKLRGKRWLSTIDLIFTMGSYGKGSAPVLGLDEHERDTWGNVIQVLCCLAVKSGWSYGVQSTKLTCGGARIWDTHRPIFVDNEFKDYDHDMHVRYVDYWKPKYATVRDLMTKEQCAELDVPYYTIDETLRMAEDVKAAGAQHVILIPKYDCVADLPDDYVMGFSVPTSYGGSPLPTEKFAGRDVHLLGGSPSLQIAYVDEFTQAGATVVSLDNNYMLKVAKYGTFWTDQRRAGHLDELGFPVGSLANPLYIALGISLGAFARYFQRDGWEEDPVVDDREGAE